METISASEYLRRERVFGEYEHERMVYNERGESVSLTQLLEDYHLKKLLEISRQAYKPNHPAAGRRQWIQLAPLIRA
jgi:flagellar basal body rod protein FlgC